MPSGGVSFACWSKWPLHLVAAITHALNHCLLLPGTEPQKPSVDIRLPVVVTAVDEDAASRLTDSDPCVMR